MNWHDALMVKYSIVHTPGWRFKWRQFDPGFGWIIWARDPSGDIVILSSITAWRNALREEKAA